MVIPLLRLVHIVAKITTLVLFVPALLIVICSVSGHHAFYGPIPTTKIAQPFWFVLIGWRSVDIGRYESAILPFRSSSWGVFGYVESSVTTGTATIGSFKAVILSSFNILLTAAGSLAAWIGTGFYLRRRPGVGFEPSFPGSD